MLRRSEILATERATKARATKQEQARLAAQKAANKKHRVFQAANECRILGSHQLPEAIAAKVARK